MNKVLLSAVAALLFCARAMAQDAVEGPMEEQPKVDRFKPTWFSLARGSVSDYSLGTGMNLRFDPGGSWVITSDLRVTYKTYRGQDAQQVTQNFMNNVIKIVPGNYSLNLSIGEIFTRKKTFGFYRSGQEMVFDDESANLDLVVNRRPLGAKSGQISAKVRMGRGINDFKYDKNIEGGAGAFLRYGFRNFVNLGVGAGTRRKRETSEISPVIFKGMPSHTDTVRAYADFGRGESKLLDVQYERYKGVDREVALPAGNSLSRVFDPENAKMEESHKKGEKILVNSYVDVSSFLSVRIAFDHNMRSQLNVVDAKLSRANEETNISATALYEYSSRGRAAFDISTSKSNVDYGPVSTSNYNDKSYSFSGRLSHSVTDSLSISLSGSSSLKQKYFEKKDINPRDADYLAYRLGFILDAKPFRSFAAKVDIMVGRYETVNIDKSLSISNKYDWSYAIRPSFVFKPTNRIRISQDYMIKIEYTDYVFRKLDNFLDRNLTLVTKADFGISRTVSFLFRHGFLLRDSGSYLLEVNERFYSPTGETRQHDLRLSLKYMPFEEFSLNASTDFRYQVFSRFGSFGGATGGSTADIYKTGKMILGFTRNKKIGDNGEINLDINYVRGFGRSLSSLNRKYWDVDAGISLDF